MNREVLNFNMGIFDWLFNNTSLGQNGEENGVDVKYTGGDVRHLNEDSKYGYDGKMVSDRSGNTHIYESSDSWISHSHDIVNQNGDTVYSRNAGEDSESHPWQDRKHMQEILKHLSIEQLIALKERLQESIGFEQDDYRKQM